MLNRKVVLVEVCVDVGPALLLLSTLFERPGEGDERYAFWDAFHKGLDAAVQAVWRPAWDWLETQAFYQPFDVGEENETGAARTLAINLATAERWSVEVMGKDVAEVVRFAAKRGRSPNGKAV